MYVNGQRSGPVVTYLQAALTRSNFHFEHSVQVKRVLRNGKQATGVIAIVQGAQKTINIAKTGRVVLSGGALFSPQLLILSGIGGTTDLQAAANAGLLSTPQSAWIKNEAVGVGLFDNPNTFIELSGPSIQSYVYSYDNPKPSDSNLYLSKRSGPYAFASQTSAFWNYVNGVGVQGTIDSAGFGGFTSKNTITLNVYGTSGLGSTGKVALNSQTGAPGPAAPFFYQSGTPDADAISTFIYDIFQALPGSGLTPLNIKQSATQQEIKTYITSNTAYTRGSVNHWSSSCRLGTCLDTNAKVKGTNNIYVVSNIIHISLPSHIC
jgi:cellobiose dehydrogenase (acceptor)